MTSNIAERLGTVKSSCMSIVGELNELGAYRSASVVQGLVQQAATAEVQIRADQVVYPPDQEPEA